jgi:hypothetical protein
MAGGRRGLERHQRHVRLLVGVHAVPPSASSASCATIGDKDAGGGQRGNHRGLVAVAGNKSGECGEVAGVGRAVVVLEVVDFGVFTGEAAPGPGLSRRIGGASCAGQGGLDVTGQPACRGVRCLVRRRPRRCAGARSRRCLAAAGDVEGLGQGEGAGVQGLANDGAFDAERHQGAQDLEVIEAGDARRRPPRACRSSPPSAAAVPRSAPAACRPWSRR